MVLLGFLAGCCLEVRREKGPEFSSGPFVLSRKEGIGNLVEFFMFFLDFFILLVRIDNLIVFVPFCFFSLVSIFLIFRRLV